MVPLLHGQWAEVKTVAIGTVLSSPGPDGSGSPRATDISYFSRRTDHETFSRLALPELHRRGTETAGVVVAVMDGSEWLQKFMDMQRPDAVRILDLPHGLEHLGVIGGSVWGAGSRAAAEWVAVEAGVVRRCGPAWVLDEGRGLGLACPSNGARGRGVGHRGRSGVPQGGVRAGRPGSYRRERVVGLLAVRSRSMRSDNEADKLHVIVSREGLRGVNLG